MRIGMLVGPLVVMAGTALCTQGHAESLPAPDRDAVREIVREYLIEHPEVIEEAMAVLGERRELERRARARDVIAQNGEALLAHPMSPVSGDADGDVTVVEFFDYRCPYCKRALAPVMELLAADERETERAGRAGEAGRIGGPERCWANGPLSSAEAVRWTYNARVRERLRRGRRCSGPSS